MPRPLLRLPLTGVLAGEGLLPLGLELRDSLPRVGSAALADHSDAMPDAFMAEETESGLEDEEAPAQQRPAPGSSEGLPQQQRGSAHLDNAESSRAAGVGAAGAGAVGAGAAASQLAVAVPRPLLGGLAVLSPTAGLVVASAPGQGLGSPGAAAGPVYPPPAEPLQPPAAHALVTINAAGPAEGAGKVMSGGVGSGALGRGTPAGTGRAGGAAGAGAAGVPGANDWADFEDLLEL
jgi:hypothetical protein